MKEEIHVPVVKFSAECGRNSSVILTRWRDESRSFYWVYAPRLRDGNQFRLLFYDVVALCLPPHSPRRKSRLRSAGEARWWVERQENIVTT